MDGYHKIVLVIAVSFLLLILITIGVMMPRKDADAPWPPVAGRCPDGWIEDATINNKCEVSIKNKGQIVSGTAAAKPNIMNGTSTLMAITPNVFRDIRKGDWLTIYGTPYMIDSVDKTGKTLVLKNSSIDSKQISYIQSTIVFDGKTICDKKNWASKWGVRWDGVSNYNKCP